MGNPFLLKINDNAGQDLITVLTSTIFFICVRYCVHTFVTAPIHVSSEREERWFNIMISLIHSVISSIWCLNW